MFLLLQNLSANSIAICPEAFFFIQKYNDETLILQAAGIISLLVINGQKLLRQSRRYVMVNFRFVGLQFAALIFDSDGAGAEMQFSYLLISNSDLTC